MPVHATRRATAIRLVVFLASLAVIASACGRGSDLVGSGELKANQAIGSGDAERVFDLYVPDGHDSGVPAGVVVLLHGQRSSKGDLTGESGVPSPFAQWQGVADEHGLLLLIPQGSEGTNGHAGWNDCRADTEGNPTTDDVGFITAALDQVGREHTVNQEQVFAVGISNGGHMTMRLADEAPERFRGIAVIAAGVPVNSSCTSSDVPMAALFMWGTADPLAPYGGGAMVSNRGQILSAEDSVLRWVDRNGVTATPDVTSFEDLDAGDDSTVTRFLYRGEGPSVALYEVAGGGHVSPSIVAQYRRVFELGVGKQNHDIEMADEVWAFFQEA